MAAKPESITGIFNRVKHRFDGNAIIADLEDGTILKGTAAEGDLIPGLSYRFYGRWDNHWRYGRQFAFTQYVKSEPHTKYSLVKYLERYAPGIGPVTAGKLFDVFGSDAVRVLRGEPERAAAAVKGLTPEKAKEAAVALSALGANEDAKIELMQLFAGRGFPHSLIEEVIKRWGILAPQRIKRDPLSLMVARFPGCGFLRCDRLYVELGLPPNKLKRQMLCLWHLMRTETEGDTWHNERLMVAQMRRLAAGATAQSAERAIRLGVRSGWLRVRNVNGQRWIADGQKAENERTVAECLLQLMGWAAPQVDAPADAEKEVEHALA